MQGWISIHREITKNWVWEEKPFSRGQAWIDLILMASHKDTKFVLGNELVEVTRGSFVTSELKLMEKWGWGKTKTRSFLKLLEDDEMIIKKSDHKKTTINIVNYSVYQDSQTTDRPQADHSQTTAVPLPYTINNDNNENQYNNIANDSNNELVSIPKATSPKNINLALFEEMWKEYPKKTGKQSIIKSASKLSTISQISLEEMQRAINRYKKDIEKERAGGFQRAYKDGGTWFNGAYLDYLDSSYTDPIVQTKDRKSNPIQNDFTRWE